MNLSQPHSKPLTITLFYSKWINQKIDASNKDKFMEDLESLRESIFEEGYRQGSIDFNNYLNGDQSNENEKKR